ncbi:MAG: hypothetical protein WCL51_07620 [Bacteroidota bacterium]
MKKNLNLKIIFIAVVGLCIFSFIVTKSNVASFTHDESLTYNRYVHQSYWEIISHKESYTNNHLLNTFLMKVSEQLFGSSELALRLPNLLLLIVLFIYTFLLFKKNNTIICIVFWILMFTNLGFINFFGLARGYGLSIGFMVMSIYHLIASFNQNKTKNLILFNIAAFLSIVSSFTLLDYYVAALFVYALIYFIENVIIEKNKLAFLKSNKVNLIIFPILFIILYEPVRKVIKFNNFDFGGKDGFIHDTLSAFISNCINNVHFNDIQVNILHIVFLMPIFISLIILIVNVFKSNKDFWYNNRPLYIINLLLIFISLGTILQHHLFKTDYVVGRFSLFLLPLFVLNLGFLMEYSLKIIKIQKYIYAFSIILLVLSSYNICRTANLYSCAEWDYDRETKNLVKDLIKMHDEGKLKQNDVKIGIDWVFEPTINFYRQTLHINWLLTVDRNRLHYTDDYYYVFNETVANIKPNTYTIIHSYDKSSTVFLKNNK